MSKQVTLFVDDAVYAFYAKVGQAAGGLPAEKVMSDALFKLAGELSLQALDKKKRPPGGFFMPRNAPLWNCTGKPIQDVREYEYSLNMQIIG